MSSAGQQLVAGRIPGEEIAFEEITADSADFTGTEVLLDTITAPLVIGRTYRVYANIGVQSTVAGDDIRLHLRETNLAGLEKTSRVEFVSALTSTQSTGIVMEFRYTALATGNFTWALTGDRAAGTGNCRIEAATNRPSYLYVFYQAG